MWFSRSSTTNSKKLSISSNKNGRSPGGDSTTTNASSVTRLNDCNGDDDDDETVDLLGPVEVLPSDDTSRTKYVEAEGGEEAPVLRYFTQDFKQCSGSSTQQDMVLSPASQTLNMLDAFNNNSTESALYLSQTAMTASTSDRNGTKSSQQGTNSDSTGRGPEKRSTNTSEELDLSVHCFCRNTNKSSNHKSMQGKKHHTLCKYHPQYDSYILDLTRSGALKGCPSCRQLLRYDTTDIPHLQTCRRNNDFKRKEKILTRKIKEAFTSTTPGTRKAPAKDDHSNDKVSCPATRNKSHPDFDNNKIFEMGKENTNHNLSSFFKNSYHIKAGIAAGCQRCIELSRKGTSDLKHGVTCPSSRKVEGAYDSRNQEFPKRTRLMHDIGPKESAPYLIYNENDVSNKYSSEQHHKQSDYAEDLTCDPTQTSVSISHQQPTLELPKNSQSQLFISTNRGHRDHTMEKIQENLRSERHPYFFGTTCSQEYSSHDLYSKERRQLTQPPEPRPRIPAPIPGDSICNRSKSGGSRWIACGNPWGPFGFVEGDVVAVFGSNSSKPPMDGIMPLRFVQEPFSNTSYIKTHCGGLGKYSAFFLRRDAFALQSWGFITCLHEFGGACLVKEVTPCSPADAAVDVGNSHTEDDNPLGGGLRVNDMILCINGKVVGGMSEVEFLTEMDISGPTMLLVIARCLDINLNGSALRSITENEASHWAFNEPLHWTEFGLSGDIHQEDRSVVVPNYMHWERNFGLAGPQHNDFDLTRFSQNAALLHRKTYYGSSQIADSVKKKAEGSRFVDKSIIQATQIHNIFEAEDDNGNQTPFCAQGHCIDQFVDISQQHTTQMKRKRLKVQENFKNRLVSNPMDPTESIPMALQGYSLQKERESIEKDSTESVPLLVPPNSDFLSIPHQWSAAEKIRQIDVPVFMDEMINKKEVSKNSAANSLQKNTVLGMRLNNETIEDDLPLIKETDSWKRFSNDPTILSTKFIKRVNRVAESPEICIEGDHESVENDSAESISIRPATNSVVDAYRRSTGGNTQKLDLLVHIAEEATKKEANRKSAARTSQKNAARRCEVIKDREEDDSVNISLYEGEEPWLSCICGKTHPSPIHVFWIQCDGCKSWYNVSPKCTGFDQDQAKSLERWHCPACKKKSLGDHAASVNSRIAEKNTCISKELQNQVEEAAENKGRPRIFSVNELVVVNYNLTGDVGKVVQVHIDYDENGEQVVSYDIRYLLGRGTTERYVDEEWVTPFDNSAYACDGTRNSKRTAKKCITADELGERRATSFEPCSSVSN